MDEEDMSREIFPLSHYATNRGRLINEAFNIIRSHRLETTIVPPSFRKYSHTELKAMCLEELEKIDTLRIVDIIEGRLTSSPKNETVRKRKSSSSSKSSQDDDTVKVKKIAKVVAVDSADAKNEAEGKKKKKKKKKLKSKEAATKHVKKNKAKVKGKKAKQKKKLEKKKQKKEAEAPKPVVVGGERTLMELLELEYRAKAIKALLKFQGFGNTKLDEIFDEKPSVNSPGPSSVIPQPSGTQEQVKSSTSNSTNPPQQSTDLSSGQAPVPTKVVEEPKQNPDPAPCEQANTPSASHSAASIAEKPEEESADENRFELSIDIEDDLDFESLPFPQKESTPVSSSCDAESQAQSPTKSAADTTTMKKKNESSDEEAAEVKFSRRSARKHSRHPRRRSTKSSDESPDGPSRSSPLPSPGKFHTSPPKSKRSSPKSKHSSPKTKHSSPRPKLSPPESKLSPLKSKLSPLKSKLSPLKSKLSLPKLKVSPLKSKLTFVLPLRSRLETDAQKPKEELKTDEEIPKQPSPAEEGEINEDGDGIDSVSSNEDELNSPFNNNSDHEKDKVPQEMSEEKRSPVEEITDFPDKKVLDSPEKLLDGESEAIAEYPPPEDIPSAETTTSCDVPKSAVLPEEIEKEDDDEAVNKTRPPKYPEEATPVTWYERWYSSKKVQKVVSSTKMYGKLRNKMISGKKNQVPNPKTHEPKKQVNPKSLLLDSSKKGGVEQPESSEHHDIPIIGSIEEYEKLFGKRIVSQNLDASPSVASAQEPPKGTETEETASQEVDEEEDEAEDDELWGDILGK